MMNNNKERVGGRAAAVVVIVAIATASSLLAFASAAAAIEDDAHPRNPIEVLYTSVFRTYHLVLNFITAQYQFICLLFIIILN